MAFGSTGAGRISFFALSGNADVDSLSQNEIVLNLMDEAAKNVLRIIKVSGQNDPVASRFLISRITIAIPAGDYFNVSLVNGTLDALEINSQKIDLADLWDQVIAGDDFFELSELDDNIALGPGNDILYGNGGKDTASLGLGENFFDGGTGIDTVIYNSKIQDFIIQRTNESWRISDRGGVTRDTAVNIERLAFSNLTLNLVVDDAARAISSAALNRIAELYVAFFNRIPDGDGMEYWIGQYRAGRTINEIAESFFNAGISFSSLTGYRSDMSHGDFINVVYRNVLGRADGADAEGLAHWTTALASGTPKGSLVSSILDAAHGSAFSDPTNPYHSVQRLLDNKLAVARQVSIDWGVNYNTSDESISKGMAIAAAVTPTATTAAIALVGVDASGMTL